MIHIITILSGLELAACPEWLAFIAKATLFRMLLAVQYYRRTWVKTHVLLLDSCNCWGNGNKGLERLHVLSCDSFFRELCAETLCIEQGVVLSGRFAEWKVRWTSRVLWMAVVSQSSENLGKARAPTIGSNTQFPKYRRGRTNLFFTLFFFTSMGHKLCVTVHQLNQILSSQTCTR